MLLYLDPARKECPASLKTLLNDSWTIIQNPIDFQQTEKLQSWVQHGGPYAIEIFKTILRQVSVGNFPKISGSPQDISSWLISELNQAIPYGMGENRLAIRQQHIFVAPSPLRRLFIKPDSDDSLHRIGYRIFRFLKNSDKKALSCVDKSATQFAKNLR